MKWKNETPREEGFYWWRFNKMQSRPVLVEIVRTTTYGLTAIHFMLDSKEVEIYSAFDGQYSEKIPMPEYARPNEFEDEEEATCQK